MAIAIFFTYSYAMICLPEQTYEKRMYDSCFVSYLIVLLCLKNKIPFNGLVARPSVFIIFIRTSCIARNCYYMDDIKVVSLKGEKIKEKEE